MRDCSHTLMADLFSCLLYLSYTPPYPSSTAPPSSSGLQLGTVGTLIFKMDFFFHVQTISAEHGAELSGQITAYY